MHSLADQSAVSSRPEVPPAAQQRLEQTVERFKDAWRRGLRPRLGDYLAGAEAERRALLLRLIQTDLDYRLRESDETRVELYLQRYPELRGDPAFTLDLIAAEYRLAHQLGRPRPLADYLRRFPEQAPALRERLASGASMTVAEMQPAQTVSAPNLAVLEETTGYEPAPHTAGVGAAVPGYEILGELGRGGMGVVYKARQVRLNRLVALKMILHADHAGTAQRERFQAEAEAVARLQHPNIVQIHEVGEHNGLPYFSLEFCVGGSLASRLAGTPLPAREAAHMVQNLAGALAAAHRAQVIHRDLKPANVLLTAAGEPKVTDFGLARKLDEAGQTASGAVMGTPSYMAPEQAAGRTHDVGPAADIYALGAILYECLTGRPPFKGATVLDTLQQVLGEEPVPPRRLVRKTPRDLETICLKSLEKEPRRRYPSAQALADDLGRWCNGEPITARPAGRLERLAKWARRRPAAAALVAVSTAALLTLLAGGAYFNQQLWVERNTALNERQRAEDREADARQEKDRAEEARHSAERQETRAEWLLHGSRLALAQHEWLNDRPDHARDLLDACRWDFRGWEQGYLRHLFHDTQHTYLGHYGPVYGVALSPDGKRIASASLERIVRVWERESGREVFTLRGHDAPVFGVAFSPDGRRLASASMDGTVRLWDADSGRPGAVLRGHAEGAHEMCFSPEGRRMASASEDGTVKVWDVSRQREVLTLRGHKGAVQSVTFSPDGRRLASGSVDRTVKLWNAQTGREILTIPGHLLPVSSLSFSPDGTRLASASWDLTLKVWDAAAGREVFTARGHTAGVNSVSFSPDGTRLASGSTDRTVRLWDASRGQLLQTLHGHAGAVKAVRFSSDGRCLASAADDATVKVWQADIDQEALVLRGHVLEASGVTFSADGTLLASSSHDNTVRLWDPRTGRAAPPLEGHTKYINAVAFRPDGRLLASASDDRTIRLWDVRSRRQVGRLDGHTLPIHRVCFSPDGSLLVSAAGEVTRPGELYVWEVRTGKRLRALVGHQGDVLCAAFHPDGKRLASGSEDRSIKVWDVPSGRELFTLQGHSEPVRSVRFSADGTLLASGGGFTSKLGAIKVWDVRTWQEVRTFAGHTTVVNDVCFSPDGSRLASASDDETVRLWSVAMGQEVLVLPTRAGAKSVEFSPDGRRLAAGGDDGDIRVWDAQTARHPLTRKEHEEPVTGACFSPDGLLLATASHDRTVKTWDLKTGRDLLTLRGASEALTGVCYSPDGARLAAGSLDGRVRVWDARTGREVFSLEGHQGQVHGVCFRGDGAQLVSCGGKPGQIGELKVWDAHTGELLRTVGEHADVVHSACYSPDGRRLVSGGRDRIVRLWDAETGREVRSFPGHTGFINRVCYSPDGSRLASAASDHTVRVWDTETGREVVCLRGHSDTVAAVAFHPDGRRLVSSSWGREVRVWEIPSGRELLVLRGHTGAVLAVCLDARGRLASAGGDAGQLGELKLWDDLMDGPYDLPSPFVASPEQLHEEESARAPAWHERQADEARQARHWGALVFHLDWLLRANPPQAGFLAWRGEARAEMGELEAAKTDFLQAARLEPDNPRFPWWLAHVCLALGDHAGYRRACERLLHNVRSKPEPLSWLALAHACTLLPDGLTDWEQVLPPLEQAAAVPSAPAERALGRVYLRAGRYRAAIEHLQRSRNQRLGAAAIPDELLLALAYYHLGQREEARRRFRQGVAWGIRERGLVQAAGTIGTGVAGPLAALAAAGGEGADPRRKRMSWAAWLDLVLLEREAQALLGPAPP